MKSVVSKSEILRLSCKFQNIEKIIFLWKKIYGEKLFFFQKDFNLYYMYFIRIIQNLSSHQPVGNLRTQLVGYLRTK